MEILQKIIANQPNVSRKGILELISYIDLTTLENGDSAKSVSQLIDKANAGFEGVFPAAVCTFSNFSHLLHQRVNKNIKTAVVGGCFPSGQTLPAAKIEEVHLIALEPIDEIDVVLNRGDFFSGNYEVIENELRGMKKAAGTKKLKVILETGDFSSPHQIEMAATLAIESGADFIKTSTGKTAIGATPEAVYIMCNCIKKHVDKTGFMVGIKPSGGIRTVQDAWLYRHIVASVLGDKWLNNNLFRIGASSLYDNLIHAYNHYDK